MLSWGPHPVCVHRFSILTSQLMMAASNSWWGFPISFHSNPGSKEAKDMIISWPSQKTTFLYDLGNINLIFQSLPDLGDQHLQHNIFMGMSIHTWMCFSLRKWSIIHIYNPHGPEYNRGYSIYNWGYNGITHLLIRIYTHKYQPCWSTTIARETLAEAACGLQPGPRRNWDKLTKYQILGA